MSLRLIETINTFTKKIAVALSDDLNIRMVIVQNKIEPEIKKLLYDKLWNSFEIQSLIAGNNRLSNVLGVNNAEARCRVIVGTAINSLNITLKRFKGVNSGLRGSLLITAIPSDYKALFALSESTISEMTQTPYNWLEYLLVYGRLPITTNYVVLTDRIVSSEVLSKYSRTGEAIMKKSIGKMTRVPEEYCGTQDNNLITRALDNIDQDIFIIINKYL